MEGAQLVVSSVEPGMVAIWGKPEQVSLPLLYKTLARKLGILHSLRNPKCCSDSRNLLHEVVRIRHDDAHGRSPMALRTMPNMQPSVGRKGQYSLQRPGKYTVSGKPTASASGSEDGPKSYT